MMTRKQWKEEVIEFLSLIAKNHYFDKSKAQKLLEADYELNEIAEQKKQSRAKRNLMNKVNGTETVRVNKAKNEELKKLLSKAMECIE